MKTVLVTGAAGFLGSHLAMHHVKAGDAVWGVDNYCSSEPDSPHMKRLTAHKNFTMVGGDISKPIHMWWMRGMSPRVDLIYNFACPASPPQYQAMPVATMKTCVVGTANVLDIAGENGAVVVHASTSEVYGDPDVSPQAEHYRGCVNPYGPRSCYDEGKRAAEALCYDYWHGGGVDARLVRIFNTYGPHMDPHDGRVVSNFIVQALKGEKLTVYGHGLQTRSFCYVDDLIRGIVAMGELPRNPGGPINLGNPQELEINEFAKAIALIVHGTRFIAEGGFESCIERRPLPVDDPLQRRPDITRAQELLGWTPAVDVGDGLRLTIEYFRNRIA